MLAAGCAGQAPKPTPAPVVLKPAGPPPKLIDVPPAVTLKEARELMAKGDWDGAKARFDAYFAKEQKSAEAFYDAGWVAEKRLDPRGASELYRKALQLDPGHTGAALNEARLNRENPAEVEPVLRAALAKHDGDPQLQNALAATLRAEKKLDEAQALVRRVLERHPKDADAYKNLAAIEADRGHVRLAESALQNARKLDDKDAGILNSLGLLAMRRDDVAAARGYFQEAVKLDPSLAPGWANLGAIALQYRDYEAAEQAYAKSVELDAERWQTRLAHGWALEGLKKWPVARGEYEKVLALKPQQEDALFGKAVALKAEGDLLAAMAAFKEYVALGKPAHAKDAEGQIASIDMRLKNPPKPPAAAQPAREKVAASGDVDLTKLPQGADSGAPAAPLPAEEAPAAAAAVVH